MTSRPAALIGVDIGCTTISGGLVTEDGAVLAAFQSPTDLGSRTGVDTVFDIVGNLCAEADSRQVGVEAIGIGLPGLVDVEQGVLRTSAGAHVADFHGFPLAERISAKTGLPTLVDNDVNALALGEWYFGLGRGSASCVVLAIGSGVGAGIIVDRRLVRGKNGYAGELGHVSVDLDGPRCVCGGRGCLAVYAGGEFMAEEARRRIAREPSSMPDLVGGDLSAVTAETVYLAASAGDRLAQTLVDRACQALGACVGLIVNTLNPEVVILTGGVVTSLVRLEDEIMHRARDYALAEAMAGTRIHFVPGAKGQTVRGGAALVLYERARRAGHPGC